jgi:hypothetical protein
MSRLNEMQQSLRRAVRVLECFVLAGLTAGCAKPLIGNSSAVIILLDYSKSFAPYANGDMAALNEVKKSITQAVRDEQLSQPVKILWAAFGDDGLQPLEPCGPARVFSQTLTGGQQDGKTLAKLESAERLTTIKSLESWLDACATAVRSTSQSTQQYTDISGALMFASDAVEDIRDNRIIVLFTDLLEDLPPSRQQTAWKIRKAKVLLVWRPGMDDQKEPSAVPQRVDAWRMKLEAAGANRVCSKTAEGLTEGEISSCLWK